MNVRETAVASRTSGYATRKAVNRTASTAKTAVQVGLAAVTGFVAGFFAGPPAQSPRRKARRGR